MINHYSLYIIMITIEDIKELIKYQKGGHYIYCDDSRVYLHYFNDAEDDFNNDEIEELDLYGLTFDNDFDHTVFNLEEYLNYEWYVEEVKEIWRK